MKILLAEDDPLLGSATAQGLELEGHEVTWVDSGDRVLQVARGGGFDCILLDLGLPEVSGQACLEQLRRGRDATPVIVITARGEKSDRIGVLDIGADDYLVKPFDLDEVAARVRAVVRRSQSPERGLVEAVLQHGPLRLSPLQRSVIFHGEPVLLKHREYWVLETLVRHRNRIVTRQYLEESMYGSREEGISNTVEVYIHHLRRKLGGHVIVTLRGQGYQIAPVDALERPPGTTASGEA